MNGYIIFSRLLKCVVVPPERYSPKFWRINRKPEVRLALTHTMNLLVKKSKYSEVAREKRLKNRDIQKKRKLVQLGIDYDLPTRHFNYIEIKESTEENTSPAEAMENPTTDDGETEAQEIETVEEEGANKDEENEDIADEDGEIEDPENENIHP